MAGEALAMKYVKFALMGFGLLAAVLALSAKVMDAGVHGVIILVGSLLPVALGVMSLATKKAMPRWASVVSLLGLLVVGMKTSEGKEFQNIMMAAAGGILCALVLAIKPDKVA